MLTTSTNEALLAFAEAVEAFAAHRKQETCAAADNDHYRAIREAVHNLRFALAHEPEEAARD